MFTPSVRGGIGIDADDFRLSPTASSDRFTFHLLRPESTLMKWYWTLRRGIFCSEQHVFEESDRDELDAIAYPLRRCHSSEQDTLRPQTPMSSVWFAC